MTVETILTDDDINKIRKSVLSTIEHSCWAVTPGATEKFARAIEQAVLQSELVQDLKQALESLENFEEIVLTEMERRFSLRGEERQYERLPIDDTQVGVEFAIKQFRALMPKE